MVYYKGVSNRTFYQNTKKFGKFSQLGLKLGISNGLAKSIFWLDMQGPLSPNLPRGACSVKVLEICDAGHENGDLYRIYSEEWTSRYFIIPDFFQRVIQVW